MIKSFCIKTNNNQILNYLLQKIEKINIDDVYVSVRQFKSYKNIIVHYVGNMHHVFYSNLAEILSSTIVYFYEKSLIRNILNSNYFYFSKIEKKEICDMCIQTLNDTIDADKKNNLLFSACLKYITENKGIVLDGFVNFRIKEYINLVDETVDFCVNNFLIEREYLEFINLLKVYIASKDAICSKVHLVYNNQESILFDDEKKVIPMTEHILGAKYLSDITFSSNDYCLNTLLNILPKKVYIHIIDKEDEFINTLKLIFNDRVYICHDCDICNVYKSSKLSASGHFKKN